MLPSHEKRVPTMVRPSRVRTETFSGRTLVVVVVRRVGKEGVKYCLGRRLETLWEWSGVFRWSLWS
jgi:hypothetical protein